MTHPSEALVRDGYAAFSRGDLDAIRAIFDPAIIWHVPGKSPVSGVYKGIDEVFELFGRLFTETGGTLAHELHDVVANDEHVVALIRQTAERNGKKLDARFAHVQHVRDGRVIESWYLSEDESAANEFWS